MQRVRFLALRTRVRSTHLSSTTATRRERNVRSPPKSAPPADNSCQPGPAQRTITTGFSTPSSRKPDCFRKSLCAARRRSRHVANVPSCFRPSCVALSLLPPLVAPACADTIGVQSAELVPDDDDYVLTAQFDVAFNPTLEEALQNGVSLYFVLEFELGRPRWYWLDEKVAQLDGSISIDVFAVDASIPPDHGASGPATRVLDEVQHLLSRVGARPVVRKDALTKGARYDAAVRLRLDVAQLPKPFQINALASRDWSLQSEWYRWSFVP